jgi:hypothetical protein
MNRDYRQEDLFLFCWRRICCLSDELDPRTNTFGCFFGCCCKEVSSLPLTADEEAGGRELFALCGRGPCD